MTIGDRIKAKRLELGLTLEDVSKIVGVTRQTIQKYESGIVSNIPSDKIELLAEALKAPPGYLMGWEKNQAANNEIPHRSLVASPYDLPALLSNLGYYFEVNITGIVVTAVDGTVVLSASYDDYSEIEANLIKLINDANTKSTAKLRNIVAQFFSSLPDKYKVSSPRIDYGTLDKFDIAILDAVQGLASSEKYQILKVVQTLAHRPTPSEQAEIDAYFSAVNELTEDELSKIYNQNE